MAKSSKKTNKAPLEPTIESVLVFDGQDDWVELPPASIPVGNEITCSFWAYGGEALPRANSVIEATDATNQRLLNIHLPWGNSIVYFDCGNTGAGIAKYDRIEKQAQPIDYKGKWSHWAFTKNATTGEMKIYLNGELWHSGTNGRLPLAQTAKARLAFCFAYSSDYYQGKLAEFQLWSRARTQAEIQQDMHRRLNGDEPGLVSYWPLNEGSGAIALDQTDNVNHGTIHGNPTWELSTLSLADATPSPPEVISIQEPTIANINELLNKPVLIENQETRRYLFCDGEPIKGNREDEGGWAASSGFESPKVVGADANYYNRALWTIVPNGDTFLIENQETKRYLFCDGEPIKGNRGDEGGWLASSGFESPKVVGADANYYNRALWTITLGIDTQPVESTKAELDVVKQSSQPASASPNISPSPSPVSPEQFIPLEQSGTLPEPASASPNVARSPLLPIEPTEPSPSATPAAAIAPPIPPVKLPGRQMVLVLDEKHQGISAGSGALRPQGQFTIEAWVYPATNAGKQVIFADGETLFYLEGGELKFHTPLSSEAIASVGAGITSGSWYHVAVPRAGSRPGETKLYINGVHNDNQKAISPVVSFGNTYLGGQPDVPDSRFQGKLLEVRVWRYARSLADIEANRLYPMTGRELGLVRCWSLNQTVESTLHDKTTNRAVGTLSSNAVWEEVEIPLKLKLDPQERLTRSTGLEDYGYWYKEMAKQHKTEADPPFRRGRIWA